MSYKTKFDLAEEMERTTFQEVTDKLNKWTIDYMTKIGDYSSYDGCITSASTKMLIEIKIRDINIDQYDSGLLEVEKCNRVSLLRDDYQYSCPTQLEALYVAIYPNDSKVAIWDIDAHTSTRMVLCPKNSQYDSEMVWKDCHFFPFSAATIYKY